MNLTFAENVDQLTIVMVVLSSLILAIVAGAMTYFGIRYRRGSPAPRSTIPPKSLPWEVSWTSIPLVIFLGLFIWGGVIYYRMHEPPPNATDIYVVGKQWMWKFQHLDGRRELNELHVPIGTPVRLIMTSQDVIHSFFIPEFRMKQDVLPDRYVYAWFQATKAGTYHLYCTQYCGTAHSRMRGEVVAMTPEDYARWAEGSTSGQQMAGQADLASAGAELFRRMGCVSCHAGSPTPPGTPMLAPDLGGLYGSTVGLRNGETVLADDNYIRESITDPMAKIVEGYQPIMPSFKEKLSEEELESLVTYVKSLQKESRR